MIKKLFRRKQNKLYDFKYKIHFKNKDKTVGEIKNSNLSPEDIFLLNKITYFGDRTCTYFSKDEINQIVITDLVEKVDDDK